MPRATVTVCANRSQSLRNMDGAGWCRGPGGAVQGPIGSATRPLSAAWPGRDAPQCRMDAKPLLLTMGDACGIGPETILKAVADGAASDCLVIGDPAVLGRAAQVLRLAAAAGAGRRAGRPGGGAARRAGRIAPAGAARRPGRTALGPGRRALRRGRRMLHRDGGEAAAGRPGCGDGDRAVAQGGAGRRRHRPPRPHRNAAGAGHASGRGARRRCA